MALRLQAGESTLSASLFYAQVQECPKQERIDNSAASSAPFSLFLCFSIYPPCRFLNKGGTVAWGEVELRSPGRLQVEVNEKQCCNHLLWSLASYLVFCKKGHQKWHCWFSSVSDIYVHNSQQMLNSVQQPSVCIGLLWTSTRADCTAIVHRGNKMGHLHWELKDILTQHTANFLRAILSCIIKFKRGDCAAKHLKNQMEASKAFLSD